MVNTWMLDPRSQDVPRMDALVGDPQDCDNTGKNLSKTALTLGIITKTL